MAHLPPKKPRDLNSGDHKAAIRSERHSHVTAKKVTTSGKLGQRKFRA